MPGTPEKDQSDWFAEFKKVAASAASKERETGRKPDERRKHFRFEIDDCQATLYRDGLLTVLGVGKNNRARAALDLSEGGVRFLTQERFPIGSKVRMIIEMERYKEQIEGSGEVRWCYQSTKNSEDYYCGVEFSDLPASEKRKIGLMRDWFTSPQYRAVRDTKRRNR
jgi:Tfp pilus assembly protein PilZ